MDGFLDGMCSWTVLRMKEIFKKSTCFICNKTTHRTEATTVVGNHGVDFNCVPNLTKVTFKSNIFVLITCTPTSMAMGRRSPSSPELHILVPVKECKWTGSFGGPPASRSQLQVGGHLGRLWALQFCLTWSFAPIGCSGRVTNTMQLCWFFLMDGLWIVRNPILFRFFLKFCQKFLLFWNQVFDFFFQNMKLFLFRDIAILYFCYLQE